MGNPGDTAPAVGGALIGFAVAGPVGAAIGGFLGYLAGGGEVFKEDPSPAKRASGRGDSTSGCSSVDWLSPSNYGSPGSTREPTLDTSHLDSMREYHSLIVEPVARPRYERQQISTGLESGLRHAVDHVDSMGEIRALDREPIVSRPFEPPVTSKLHLESSLSELAPRPIQCHVPTPRLIDSLESTNLLGTTRVGMTDAILNPVTREVTPGSFSDPLGPRVYGGQPVHLEPSPYLGGYTVRRADGTPIGRAM